MSEKPFEGWAILELMGHRRLAGFISQVEMFGAAMLRIDVPGPDEVCTLCGGGLAEAISDAGPVPCEACQGTGRKHVIAATQFYGGSSIYCLTPTTEETARAFALRNQPAPVQRWELPALEQRPRSEVEDDLYDDDDR